MGNSFKKEKKPKKSNANGIRIQNTARSVMDGTFLTREKAIKLFPFVLYLTFLAIIYIANSYYAEKRIIEIDKIKKEIKELRYTYISTEKKTRLLTKQSEVAKKLKVKGIRESTVPPKKITAN